ncbi:MAG: type II toxin-antitoxin system VapC family toxin [Deltaproteobacteria bacterium]|nr:type II toxin-antitoxin system VapC family toxin [Deltaproteobacteria bacterium]
METPVAETTIVDRSGAMLAAPRRKAILQSHMTLLDSDVLIDLLREHAQTLAWFDRRCADEDRIAISVITKLEILSGSRGARERRTIAGWLKWFECLHLTDHISRKAELLFTQYHPRQGLGILDALIAGTAICENAVLYSGNLRHFRNLPGLQLKAYR